MFNHKCVFSISSFKLIIVEWIGIKHSLFHISNLYFIHLRTKARHHFIRNNLNTIHTYKCRKFSLAKKTHNTHKIYTERRCVCESVLRMKAFNFCANVLHLYDVPVVYTNCHAHPTQNKRNQKYETNAWRTLVISDLFNFSSLLFILYTFIYVWIPSPLLYPKSVLVILSRFPYSAWNWNHLLSISMYVAHLLILSNPFGKLQFWRLCHVPSNNQFHMRMYCIVEYSFRWWERLSAEKITQDPQD